MQGAVLIRLFTSNYQAVHRTWEILVENSDKDLYPCLDVANGHYDHHRPQEAKAFSTAT